MSSIMFALKIMSMELCGMITGSRLFKKDIIKKTKSGFGYSGLSLSESKNINCKIDALYALEDQEIYDIEYLATFGETQLEFVKAFTTVGKANDWFTPVDIPYNKTNVNSIKSYFRSIDNDSNVMAVGPFDKNTEFTGWLNLIAASLYFAARS